MNIYLCREYVSFHTKPSTLSIGKPPVHIGNEQNNFFLITILFINNQHKQPLLAVGDLQGGSVLLQGSVSVALCPQGAPQLVVDRGEDGESLGVRHVVLQGPHLLQELFTRPLSLDEVTVLQV